MAIAGMTQAEWDAACERYIEGRNAILAADPSGRSLLHEFCSHADGICSVRS